MIPRLKPYWGKQELQAVVDSFPGAIEKYEHDFARDFDAEDAVSASYGRAALYMMIKALGIQDAEIVMPAYTCVVVGHAIVLSGNRPRFVDCSLQDYNTPVEAFAEAINEHTRMVIPTHVFGYPLDVFAVQEAVHAAEHKYGHKIYVVQDVCHSFGADWEGEPVHAVGDAALFGSNISKTLTSIYGGMLTFNDKELADRVRAWRDAHFKPARLGKSLRRSLYVPAAQLAFSRAGYNLVYALQQHTPLLKGITDAYHLDDKVHFPPDYETLLAPVEARVGEVQLKRYKHIIARRRANAAAYFDALASRPGWELPPQVEGATYSHFVIRVQDRAAVLKAAAKMGIELGQLIEYSVPELGAYQEYTEGIVYENAALCARSMINLPVYAGLRPAELEQVIDCMGKLQETRW